MKQGKFQDWTRVDVLSQRLDSSGCQNSMGHIYEEYVLQETVRMAFFTQVSAFINLDVTAEFAQISCQV